MLGDKTPKMSPERYMTLYGLQVISPAPLHLILTKAPRGGRSNTVIPTLPTGKSRLRG